MKIAEEEHLSDHIIQVGFQSNPYQWIKHADCLVLPSRVEGLPNVLIEAQYLGTPAAATKPIPMISRIIDEGINGYAVDCEDSLALAEAIIKASRLGRIPMSYKPATGKDIIDLFV